MILRIADFVFDFQQKHHGWDCYLYPYEIKTADSIDYSFSYSEEEIVNYINTKFPSLNKGRAEAMMLFDDFANIAPNNRTFLFHCALIALNNKGIAFLAQSGTGKTTHMLNWQKLLGKEMIIVNGDKPFVRYFNEEEAKKFNAEANAPYGYGAPWSGKEHLDSNTKVRINHLCFIQRSETNCVEKLSKNDAVDRIMKQVFIPKDAIALANTIKLTSKLIDNCECWVIHCNTKEESARMAYDTIIGGK